MFYVYILESMKDKGYYTGSSKNPYDRLIDHNRGSVKATNNRRPFVIVHTEGFATRSEALAREKQIKSYKGGKVFKQLLVLRQSEYDGLSF